MATLPEAFAEIVEVPETVAPANGAVMETEGDPWLEALDTVTDTEDETPVLPEVSVAMAPSVWAPFAVVVVFHEYE
jgi:hypothetical protein